MNSPHDDYPRICHDSGLTCESCTSETARQLAQCCKGLRGGMIGQMFVQIYPHSACAPMHAYFAACYREESVAFPDGRPMRKPAAMAAVA